MSPIPSLPFQSVRLECRAANAEIGVMRGYSQLVILTLSLIVAATHEASVRSAQRPSTERGGADADVRAAWQEAGSSRIRGPTGELLPPQVAVQLLTGADYVEWCLRWNEHQHEVAARRAVAPRQIRGWVTQRRSSSQGSLGGQFFGRGPTGVTTRRSTTRSHEQIWLVGGYGGGPVTLYNPFVPPTPAAVP